MNVLRKKVLLIALIAALFVPCYQVVADKDVAALRAKQAAATYAVGMLGAWVPGVAQVAGVTFWVLVVLAAVEYAEKWENKPSLKKVDEITNDMGVSLLKSMGKANFSDIKVPVGKPSDIKLKYEKKFADLETKFDDLEKKAGFSERGKFKYLNPKRKIAKKYVKALDDHYEDKDIKWDNFYVREKWFQLVTMLNSAWRLSRNKTYNKLLSEMGDFLSAARERLPRPATQ